MIVNLFLYLFEALGAFFPAALGVIACDRLAHKAEEWKVMLWLEVLIFSLAFSCVFVSKPIELSIFSTVTIPTSLGGALLIGHGIMVMNDQVEYCGRERLYEYGVLSIMIGVILLLVRMFVFKR